MSREHWPCLMYHELLSQPWLSEARRRWFSVASEDFTAQLDMIRSRRMAGCSIESALVTGGPRVAISFDDGMLSDYQVAFPALLSRGMAATFFVVTDRVGTSGHASWAQLREMADAGMSIQSHTRSHPFLSELQEDELRSELVDSKRALDDALGQDTTQLAYPGGDAPTPRLMGVVAEAGYQVIATSKWGANVDPSATDVRFIRRCTVAGAHDEQQFDRILALSPLLTVRRRLRESIFSAARRALGPTRYANWRLSVLDRTVPTVEAH